jgi:hypothetical protein
MKTYPNLQIALAVAAVVAFTIAGYCAPTGAPGTTLRTFDYDITVPLFYNGRNIGSTVIPKGNQVEVTAETAATITIRHMGNTLTLNKPGATPVQAAAAAAAAATAPKVTAQPAKSVMADAEKSEYARMARIPKRILPYPVMRVEIEADGSYTLCGQTCSSIGPSGIGLGRYSYEKVGTKLRLFSNEGYAHIWEAEEADTLENKVKTDPRLVDAIKADIAAGRNAGCYTYDSYLEQFATKEHNRVSFGLNKFAISKHTPLKDVMGLIAKRDPRMQSLINAADAAEHSGGRAPANCEYVGMTTIAKEILDDEKSITPAAVSLRDEVEKLGVKHRRQPGNECTVYSAYHLLDFHMRKGDIRPFTLEQFKAMVPGLKDHIFNNELLEILAQTQPGLNIRVRKMERFGFNQTSFFTTGCDGIYRAFLQHELAAGRPVWLGVGGHKVMLVGYDPDAKAAYNRMDGIKFHRGPRLTALDSTGYGDDDHNYSVWDIRDASTAISLEFIKPAEAAVGSTRN